MTRRRAWIAAGSVVAILAGYYGLIETSRIEAKNRPGPVSTIGRSGDLKSPGGTSEAEERRRI